MATPAAFLPHLGNNHASVYTKVRRGGGVRFKEHLGQPLTDRLWEDLAERLGVGGISVYRPDQDEWTIGRFNHASIYLDETGLVTDIYYSPPLPR